MATAPPSPRFSSSSHPPCARSEDAALSLAQLRLEECGLEAPASPVSPNPAGKVRAGAEGESRASPVVVAEKRATGVVEKGGEFDRFGLPSREELKVAQACELVDEFGDAVSFGSLVRQRGQVVVVFLRHMWCGLCQQYVVALKNASRSLSSLSLSSPATSAPPFYLLLISTGSPSLIPIYRARLECPFPLYVDPKRALYKALGMTRRTLDGGKSREKGSYITKSAGANVVASTLSGLAMRKNPGDQKQLGGEFVMASRRSAASASDDGDQGDDAEMECLYASRMSTTRNHAEVRELFRAAGVELELGDSEGEAVL